MKSYKTILSLLTITLATLSLTNCGKKDNGSTTATNGNSTNNPYNYNNGYNNGYNYNTGNYYLQNNQCLDRNTNAVVDMSLCNGNQNGYPNNGYNTGSNWNWQWQGQWNWNSGGYSSCVGTYYVRSYYNMIPVYCNGSNCRGATLLTQNGQYVVCQ